MGKAKMVPAAGLKNWRSNPPKAVRVGRVDGPPGGMFGGVYAREHFDGHQDGRVGGGYVDAETEDRWRKGLIPVSGLVSVTLADLESSMRAAKDKFYANRDDPKARQAFIELKRMLDSARAGARRQDPRRLAAIRGE